MNEIVEKAIEINKKCKDDCFDGMYIPDLEIGEVCELNDVWDGEGDEEDIFRNSSCSMKITDDGEDGVSNYPIWINYEFEVLEEKENPLDTIVKITKIELL